MPLRHTYLLDVSLLGEDALGGCDLAPAPLIHLRGNAQRARKRLERRLHDVVRVLAGQLADVERHATGGDQRLEKVLHQLHLILADALRGEVQVAAQVRPPRQVLRKKQTDVIAVV